MKGVPRLYVTRRRRRGHTVVTAVGTITQDTVIQLRTVLLQALARRERSLLLDLAGIDDIDDAGLDALRRTADRAQIVGGRLRLVAPAPSVAARLRATGLSGRIPVTASLAAALDHAPGVEDPPADWLDQQQPVDPGAEDELAELEIPMAEVSLEADHADYADQHQPVPFDENDYPIGT